MQKEIQAQQNEQIKGLYFYDSFISVQEEKQLISSLLKQPWNTSLKRRTQHYGYEYSYDRKSKATKTTQIPEWCLDVKKRIEETINRDIKPENPVFFNQLIINEYEPGQGINGHVDNINLFTDVVVSLSLGSPAIMNFEKDETKVEIVLKRCSLIVLQGEARYQWKHSIPSRKSDHGVIRSVRYSLTFRQMKEDKS